jgi:rRNA maturation RNase YbeY
MSLLRFFNRQRALALERPLLRRIGRCLLEDLVGWRDYELGVHFVSAGEMTGLNETFLHHEGSTDVITFDHRQEGSGKMLCGEIFISTEDALTQARRFRTQWPWEVTRYLVHGVLHLEGYNDTEPAARRVMKRRENKLLKDLSARFDLGKLGKPCR